METTITITSLQENAPCTIIIEIPIANVELTIQQPSTNQPSINQPSINQLPICRQQTKVKEENIEIKNDKKITQESVINIEDESLDCEIEMDPTYPSKTLYIISDDDYSYSPASQFEYFSSSTDLESSDDGSSNTGSQVCFDSSHDIIKHLQQDVLTQ